MTDRPSPPASTRRRRALRALRPLVQWPQILAFGPALTLAGYWFGGEGALLLCAIFLPAGLALLGLPGGNAQPPADRATDPATGLPLAGAVETALEEALAEMPRTGRRTACLALAIDDHATHRARLGAEAWDRLLHECAFRLQQALRSGDTLARDGEGGFCVALAPVPRLDLEALIQLSARLQEALSGGFAIGGQRLHVTASVGFALLREAAEASAQSARAAAHAALRAAQINGPGSIRAHAPSISPAAHAPRTDHGHAEIERAFEKGEIVAWFQPQISTDTGRVSGMEALARWVHPERGVIAPAAFLPLVEAAGLQARLTDRMLSAAAEALRSWDEAGAMVPRVAVNFSQGDLADPMLAERVRWAFDRAGAGPDRLVVEILETVLSEGADDAVSRTIARLSELGCSVDLDDFGTGHAGIAQIRRFRVNRIKIDRSLVTRVDVDGDQRNLVAAILELAERLGIETLAEGVETLGEHAILAQLGCGHVQGYGIARPMPLHETLSWLAERARKTAGPVWSDRQAG